MPNSSDRLRNWAGNIEFGPAALDEPATLADVQALVRRSPKVRVIGSRHSFNRIADTDGALLSLRHLDSIHIDREARTATIGGGVTYGALAPVLDAAGFALPNLASLPHITVVGAVATATHGSGNANRNLAAPVAGLDLVTATGDLVSLSRRDADFDGAVVALGALGVVVSLTLDILPRFDIRQNLYLGLPFTTLADNFEAISSSAYSVSAFTRWAPDEIDHLWLKSRADAPSHSGDFFGARPADRNYHPISAIDPAPATEQMDVPGPWHERLPHFRMAFRPSAGAELQSEYFVARAAAPAALRALKRIGETIAGPLMVSEIRTMAADELWLSMNYREDCVAFHFTWHPDWNAVRPVLGAIEAALAPFKPRPHWGKLFTMPASDIQARYPRLADFRALAGRMDPKGKFRNAFLDEIVF